MRVQSINQNYPQCSKKQKVPSFQSTFCLINRKPPTRRKINTVVYQINTMFSQCGNWLGSKVIPVLGNGRRSAKRGVPHCVVVDTGTYSIYPENELRKYAKDNGFFCYPVAGSGEDSGKLRQQGHIMAANFARLGHV